MIVTLIITTPVLHQVLPSLVLTNSNSDPTFLSTLESTLSTLSIPSSHNSHGYDSSKIQLEFRPSRDFSSVNGKDSLSQLNIIQHGIYSSPNLNQEDHKSRVQGDHFIKEVVFEDDDRTRRNKDLRLGSFLNEYDSSPLTVSFPVPSTLAANADLSVNEIIAGLRECLDWAFDERNE